MNNGPYDVTLPARFSYLMRAAANAYLLRASRGEDEQEAWAAAMSERPLATGDEATVLAHLRSAGAMV